MDYGKGDYEWTCEWLPKVDVVIYGTIYGSISERFVIIDLYQGLF